MIRISRRGFLRAGAIAPAARLLAWQDQTPPKFSADVNVVNVLVTVRDKDGKIVPNLTKDDFSITEDGRPQVLRYFTQQFDSPLKLGLLVDTSGSERRNIAAERRASDKFIDQVIRQGMDKAFVIHFDRQVELLQDLTGDRTQLQKALDELTVGESQAGRGQGRGGRRGGGRGQGMNGGTLLYDAVFLAADEILRKEDGRKAAILFSDGEDTGSKETLSNAIEAAQRADMLVYSVRFFDPSMGLRPSVGIGPIGTSYPRDRQDRGDGKPILQRISAETGGAYFEANGGASLDKIYARIEDELRNQYSLGYSSDQNGAGYRMIRVAAKGKNLTVQAREGYYAK